MVSKQTFKEIGLCIEELQIFCKTQQIIKASTLFYTSKIKNVAPDNTNMLVGTHCKWIT